MTVNSGKKAEQDKHFVPISVPVSPLPANLVDYTITYQPVRRSRQDHATVLACRSPTQAIYCPLTWDYIEVEPKTRRLSHVSNRTAA
jgi:hypothetical protein